VSILNFRGQPSRSLCPATTERRVTIRSASSRVIWQLSASARATWVDRISPLWPYANRYGIQACRSGRANYCCVGSGLLPCGFLRGRDFTGSGLDFGSYAGFRNRRCYSFCDTSGREQIVRLASIEPMTLPSRSMTSQYGLVAVLNPI
jgi:hypothetical protein